MQCMASVQRRKPECPLCRAAFPVAGPLTVNVELRDLIALAATLHTVEEPDGWQTLAAVKVTAVAAALRLLTIRTLIRCGLPAALDFLSIPCTPCLYIPAVVQHQGCAGSHTHSHLRCQKQQAFEAALCLALYAAATPTYCW